MWDDASATPRRHRAKARVARTCENARRRHSDDQHDPGQRRQEHSPPPRHRRQFCSVDSVQFSHCLTIFFCWADMEPLSTTTAARGSARATDVNIDPFEGLMNGLDGGLVGHTHSGKEHLPKRTLVDRFRAHPESRRRQRS